MFIAYKAKFVKLQKEIFILESPTNSLTNNIEQLKTNVECTKNSFIFFSITDVTRLF